MTWVVVGREHSGDEDENVSPIEAFGPFPHLGDAMAWMDTAPTFEGERLYLTLGVEWLLDLFGVPLRNPDLAKEPPECSGAHDTGPIIWPGTAHQHVVCNRCRKRLPV